MDTIALQDGVEVSMAAVRHFLNKKMKTGRG